METSGGGLIAILASEVPSLIGRQMRRDRKTGVLHVIRMMT